MQFFDNVLFIKIARYIVFSSGLFGLGIVLCVGSDILIILLISFSFFLSRTGDITQKGYEKKRSRLLAPYLPKPPTSSAASSTAAGKFPTIRNNI